MRSPGDLRRVDVRCSWTVRSSTTFRPSGVLCWMQAQTATYRALRPCNTRLSRAYSRPQPSASESDRLMTADGIAQDMDAKIGSRWRRQPILQQGCGLGHQSLECSKQGSRKCWADRHASLSQESSLLETQTPSAAPVYQDSYQVLPGGGSCLVSGSAQPAERQISKGDLRGAALPVPAHVSPGGSPLPSSSTSS